MNEEEVKDEEEEVKEEEGANHLIVATSHTWGGEKIKRQLPPQIANSSPPPPTFAQHQTPFTHLPPSRPPSLSVFISCLVIELPLLPFPTFTPREPELITFQLS